MSVEIRFAKREDVPVILGFVNSLAKYEKLENEVTATVSKLEASLFDRKRAEVLIANSDGVDVGFMLFFHNFSTFLGEEGIYLEDYYVLEEYRNKGIGKQLFKKLTDIALERNCDRVDWVCLDWNEPSLEFYKKIDAIQMNGWIIHRLKGSNIAKLNKKLS